MIMGRNITDNINVK